MEPLAERMRPRTLDDYVGQEHLVGPGGVVRRMIESGRLSSFILWGPPGVGKTTLAEIVASEMKVPFYTLSAVTSGVKDVREAIEKAKNGRFFNNASPILFIDEIHRFSKSQQDSLLGAVERGIVTLIGATTRSGMLTAPLRARFGINMHLQYYDPATLQRIIKRSASLLKVPIEDAAAVEISRRSRGTPRIANGLLRRVRDFAQVKGNGTITKDIADIALTALNIDSYGLDEIDNKILTTIIDKFRGGPVGVSTIATAIGEDAGTVEEVYEPFLIMEGFIKRTPRGRMATSLAYEHLGRNMYNTNQEQPTLF